MTINTVEIYPYPNKKKPYRKRSSTDNDIAIQQYAHDLYTELFNSISAEKIFADVLQRVIDFTGSKDGFVALVNQNEHGANELQYHCINLHVDGVSFLSHPGDCKFDLGDDSLLASAQKNIVISNKVQNDPRSIARHRPLPDGHPHLATFLGIPLTYKNTLVGMLGLANAEKYTVKKVGQLFPIQQFLSNFIHLWKQRRLTFIKEVEMKKEIITLKDSFIAAMSHEIRTPISGMMGMTTLLSETPLNEKQKRYVYILTECGTQLLELVNDILDFSKMSTGIFTLNNHSFNIRDCIKKAVEIVAPRAAEKKIDLDIVLDDSLPDNVVGDYRRLHQVLFNLLINAIKFTNEGKITLSARSEEIIPDKMLCKKRNKIYFSIADTGIGIKPADQERIFDVFTKLSNEPSTSVSPGTGMGLSISKYIVNNMQGEISVESDGIHGSTFTFYVVLDDETDIIKMLADHSEKLAHKKIIIVDDTEDNRIYLADILDAWGIETIVFGSGREALNYIEKKKPFDIAIIDLCMPNMSGVELTQSIRERGFTQPVIGLSSIGNDIQGKEWFDYFVTKPIGKSHLFNLVVQCVVKNCRAGSVHEFSESPELSPSPDSSIDNEHFKILVAEDDRINQIWLSELLKNLGYSNVTIVGDGEQCVAATKNDHYNVCLMDVKMPKMNGLDATRIIKQQTRPPTIIAVSASVLDSDKNKCYDAGMDGYIPKPINKDRLAAMLKSLQLRTST